MAALEQPHTGTPARPLRVLFLLQRPEGWLNVRSVWEYMCDADDFAPTLLVLPNNVLRPETNPGALQRWQGLLNKEGATFHVWSDDAPLHLADYDVAVFTVPYDRERPPALHFDRVAEAVPVTAYIPYGLAMGAGRSNEKLQYAQPTQALATAVYVRSHHERVEYRNHCPRGDRHVHLLGHPRFDSLFDLEGFETDPALTEEIGNRFPVLWNSHFSFAPKHAGLWEYSTFDRVGPDLLKFATNNPDVALIWRPHPHLFSVLQEEGVMSLPEVADLRAELQSVGIIYDDRPDYRHAFKASRLLLTDLGSFLVEYLATGRPIVYLHNSDGQGLNSEGRLLSRYIDIAQSGAETVALIERVRLGAHQTGQSLDSALREFVPYFDGQAGARIARHIHSLTTSTMSSAGAVGSREFEGAPLLQRMIRALERMRTEKEAVRSRGWLPGGIAFRGVRQIVAQEVRSRPALMRIVNRFLS